MRVLLLLTLFCTSCVVGIVTPTPTITPTAWVTNTPTYTPTPTVMITPTPEWNCGFVQRYTLLYQDVYLQMPVLDHHHDFPTLSFDHSHAVELYPQSEVIRIARDVLRPVWYVVTAGDTDPHFGYVSEMVLFPECR